MLYQFLHLPRSVSAWTLALGQTHNLIVRMIGKFFVVGLESAERARNQLASRFGAKAATSKWRDQGHCHADPKVGSVLRQNQLKTDKVDEGGCSVIVCGIVFKSVLVRVADYMKRGHLRGDDQIYLARYQKGTYKTR